MIFAKSERRVPLSVVQGLIMRVMVEMDANRSTSNHTLHVEAAIVHAVVWCCGFVLAVRMACQILVGARSVNLLRSPPSLDPLVVDAFHEDAVLIKEEHVDAFLDHATRKARDFTAHPHLPLDLVNTGLLDVQGDVVSRVGKA